MAANPEVEAYIRAAARARGIDENVAVAVSKAEALNVFDPTKPDMGGDEGSSFGPFQLHYKGMSKSMPNAGMGDEFTRATGLHARDPSTWKQQVDFALDTAKRDGWRQWMGAANTGIPRWSGINGGGGGGGGAETVQGAYTRRPAGPEEAAGGGSKPDLAPASGYVYPTGGGAPGPSSGGDMPAMPVIATKEKRKNLAELMGDALGRMGGGGQSQLPALPNQPAAARIDAPTLATTQGQRNDLQRQQLAFAMQRLNGGTLW